MAGLMPSYLKYSLQQTKHFSRQFGNKTMRDFQLLVSRFFLGLENNRGMLLFQDTGFGKTLTTVYMINMLKSLYHPHWKILILCKASLIEKPWSSTIMEFCNDLTNFHIISYDDPTFVNKFSTYIKGITQNERVFLVIDECHNFISRNLTKDGQQRKMKRVYNEIVKLIHGPKKNKILLLSASPLVNDVNEFFLMINLLRPGVLGNDVTLFRDNILIYKDELVRGLQGICSYKRNHTFSIFDDIQSSDGFAAKRVKFKEVVMSETQEALYQQAEKYERENGLTSFKSIRRVVSAFAYKELPARQTMKDDEFEKYLEQIRINFSMEFSSSYGNGFTPEGLVCLKTNNPSDLDSHNQNIYNRLYEYSAKYTTTCLDIVQSAGKCLIFEPFVKSSGINILIEYLKIFGISFIEFSGRTKSTRNQSLDSFNHPDNILGDKIKVCVFSMSGSEGVSYTGINDIFILDITWNEASLKQIMGRAIRMNSHQMLPVEKRYTNVNFIICKKSRGISVDQELLSVVKNKSRQIDQLFDVLRLCSVEDIFEREDSNEIPGDENFLINYFHEPIEFKTKTYRKEFINVQTIYYTFDIQLKIILIGYIDKQTKLIYSEDGFEIGKLDDNTIIKIKNRRLIHVLSPM